MKGAVLKGKSDKKLLRRQQKDAKRTRKAKERQDKKAQRKKKGSKDKKGGKADPAVTPQGFWGVDGAPLDDNETATSASAWKRAQTFSQTCIDWLREDKGKRIRRPCYLLLIPCRVRL